MVLLLAGVKFLLNRNNSVRERKSRMKTTPVTDTTKIYNYFSRRLLIDSLIESKV